MMLIGGVTKVADRPVAARLGQWIVVWVRRIFVGTLALLLLAGFLMNVWLAGPDLIRAIPQLIGALPSLIFLGFFFGAPIGLAFLVIVFVVKLILGSARG